MMKTMKTTIFNIKRLFTAALAVAAVSLSACSLEEDMKSNYSPDNFYRSAAECEAGLNGCYIPARSIFNGTYMLVTESITDLMYCNSGTRDAELDITPANPRFGNTMWNNGYQGVMRANNVLAAIDRCEALTERERAILHAEGVIHRAYYYWILTNNFKDVPFYTDEIRTTEDQLRIAKYPRMSAIDTRRFLVDDLEEALSSPYVPQRRTFGEGSEYRMGAAVGWMVAAKLCMWNASAEKHNPDLEVFKMEHPYHQPYEGGAYWWKRALTMLQHLEDIYGDLSQYPIEDNVFSKKYTLESIWENSNIYDEQGLKVTINVASFFTPSRSSASGGDAGYGTDAYYGGISIPELGGYARTYTAFRPNQYFYQQLQNYENINRMSRGENYDKRIFINLAWGWDAANSTSNPLSEGFLWFKNFTSSSRPWMGYKFWCPGMRNTSDSNNHRIFRYAAVPIMQAECHLMLGDRTRSAEYLNKVRSRAGLGPVIPENYRNTAAFLIEIQKEHGRELIGEFQRKHEMVRWGTWYEGVLDNNNNTAYSKLLFENIRPCHEYYPIPDRQCSYSGGALDNKAYNEYGM